MAEEATNLKLQLAGLKVVEGELKSSNNRVAELEKQVQKLEELLEVRPRTVLVSH